MGEQELKCSYSKGRGGEGESGLEETGKGSSGDLT